MTVIPLRLGPLGAEGFVLHRSGIRWLYEDGHICKPGEVIAYCNIGLLAKDRQGRATDPFKDEMVTCQVAFAPMVGGRLRKSPDSSHGGFLDQLYFFLRWHPDFVIGHIECPPGEKLPSNGQPELRLLMLAGRRVSDVTGGQGGLLSGWFQRCRAWWADDDGPMGTVLSLGICELNGIVRGERGAFLEFFGATRGPAHMIHVADNLVIPTTVSVTEQFRRSPAEFQAISADLAQSFANSRHAPGPKDWLFAGALMTAMQYSPMNDQFDILTRSGLQRTGPPDAVILSLGAEPPVILRHRRLGYALNCHGFRLSETGPAMSAWLRDNFEPVPRTFDDILRDYCALIDTVRAVSNTQFLILNTMSTTTGEDIYSYQAFDRPMGSVLRSVRGKELNLLLHDLVRLRDAAIVDVDAIVAEMGSASHLLPDGVHSSGTLQAEIRAEIIRNLRMRGVPGFASA